jgi:hypothetical protein
VIEHHLRELVAGRLAFPGPPERVTQSIQEDLIDIDAAIGLRSRSSAQQVERQEQQCPQRREVNQRLARDAAQPAGQGGVRAGGTSRVTVKL